MTQRPGINFTLLREVLRRHLMLFGLLLALGAVFLAASLLLFFNVWLPDDAHSIAGIIGIAVFFLCGLFLVGFAFISTYSSARYYYQKGLLRQHGVNTSGTVVTKTRQRSVGKVGNKIGSSDNDYIDVDELELLVRFQFHYAGRDWEGEDLLGSERLYTALVQGQTVPLRMLPWDPTNAIIRQQALRNQIKREHVEENDPRIGQPLIDIDKA